MQFAPPISAIIFGGAVLPGCFPYPQNTAMKTVTEVLTISHLKDRQTECLFGGKLPHSRKCICAGTGFIKACDKCAGSGWNGAKNAACGVCHGRGAVPAPK